MFCLRPIPIRRLRALLSACGSRFRPLGLATLLAASCLLPAPAVAQTGPGVTKQSLGDLIRDDKGDADLSADTTDRVRAFLDDKSKPVRDRLDVKIAFEQARLKRRAFAGRDEQLQAHADHAAELIRDYPEQPEGYGYLLSLAKAESPQKARRMAESLLGSAAPAPLKQGARRVLDRLALEGAPLQLAGAESALAAARGRPLVIYAWTAGNAGVLDAVRQLARTTDFGFIGVNLDPDATAAKSAAASLPGIQFYDGTGLDGPLARQLQLTMTVALYLVDARGVVFDVDAHRDPAASLTRLIGGSRK